jgi:hypothetical protein
MLLREDSMSRKTYAIKAGENAFYAEIFLKKTPKIAQHFVHLNVQKPSH